MYLVYGGGVPGPGGVPGLSGGKYLDSWLRVPGPRRGVPAGFPLFWAEKVPRFPDFSSIFFPFSSIFFMFYFFN